MDKPNIYQVEVTYWFSTISDDIYSRDVVMAPTTDIKIAKQNAVEQLKKIEERGELVNIRVVKYDQVFKTKTHLMHTNIEYGGLEKNNFEELIDFLKIESNEEEEKALIKTAIDNIGDNFLKNVDFIENSSVTYIEAIERNYIKAFNAFEIIKAYNPDYSKKLEPQLEKAADIMDKHMNDMFKYDDETKIIKFVDYKKELDIFKYGNIPFEAHEKLLESFEDRKRGEN